MISDEEPDYEQGGKKSNSANQHLPPPPQYSPPQHFPQGEGEQRTSSPQLQLQNGLDTRTYSANSYPLRPCLRVRSDSDCQNEGEPSKGQQLSIRWHDISGCGELVEVHEYEPSESDYSGDYANGEKSCCSIM
mmetsp:Transcript_24179/g.66175  ORF Transcript_24179/g.66175 Transcript_24179/m.66175 type:complete len:133 (-) Transcript_24179:836-1234(-)|eukprot:CAMPEP_0202352266 /NCGR_PEP_ID=MMETSP1126-20121109/8531_1 /ASSEMBLY_ACC=CAM_ASM_000457 /TAXON_ID=3047 /ORGANISM="Dunaliella tertiolecta, Strain CCMP1320" /LENGTH=132 /DNA_ID=CAMNT_0048944451 /DNA_START=187 /DNA_END=585 /DNA_ORIENTATION=-